MNKQSVKTPILTPDDHLFLLSTAVDTLQKITELPEPELHALVSVDGFSYQHGSLSGLLFILNNKVSALFEEQPIDSFDIIAIQKLALEVEKESFPAQQRDYTILPADLGRSPVKSSVGAGLQIWQGQGGTLFLSPCIHCGDITCNSDC
ncbi:MAG TPA: hypothetical protein VIF37_01500 [Methylobacter sp.]|jgi:hypothetical protein